MTDHRLVPCPGCARHVRVRDAACPFCGVSIADASGAAASMRVLRKRLPRAALFAVGAGTIAIAACGDSSSSGPGMDVGDSSTDAPMATALYGGPPGDGGALPVDASHDASDHDTGIMASYGGPPIDSGLPTPDADTD